MKCGSTTNSLCGVCKWFERIGYDTVSRFYHNCSHADHSRESLQVYPGENKTNALTWIKIEPALRVCSIAHCTWRTFETKFAGKPGLESAFTRLTSRQRWNLHPKKWTKLTFRALSLCQREWRRANAPNVSFVISSRCKFDLYQLVWYQSFVFHFTNDTASKFV